MMPLAGRIAPSAGQCKLTTLLLGLLSVVLVLPARGDELPDRLTIATWNVEWFYDDNKGDNISDLARQQSAPARREWQWKLQQVADVIARIRPTILALQEVENGRVLDELAKLLRQEHGLRYRTAFIEGTDNFTEQDVGLLYQSGLIAYSRREQSLEMFNSRQYYNITKQLFAEFQWQHAGRDQTLLLLTVHLRSGEEDEPIRLQQGALIQRWIEDTRLPNRHIVVLGDFNTTVARDGAARDNDLGAATGLATDDRNDDLIDLHSLLDANARWQTHISGRALDRILVSPSLVAQNKRAARGNKAAEQHLRFNQLQIRRDLVVRGRGPDNNHADNYWQMPPDERDISDHYPVVAEFTVGSP